MPAKSSETVSQNENETEKKSEKTNPSENGATKAGTLGQQEESAVSETSAERIWDFSDGAQGWTFDSSAFTTGNITVKAAAGNVFNEQMSGINGMEAEDAEGKLKKVTFRFEIDTAAAKTETPDKLMLLTVGSNTDYNGYVCFDNIRLYQEEKEDPYVDASVKADTGTRISNEAIKEGALMTLSAHMPNFAFAVETDKDAAKTYDRYDYMQADSYNLKGDCMNQILPGGAYHEAFTAYLDMVAEYAKQVDGAVLFRPFHENTGSWFWWGKAFCEPETYKSVYKYTVEYLRDTKDVHNILYLYGPGSEAASIAEYGERYPGDAYVDLVGFDTYDSNPETGNTTFMTNFENTVKLTSEFAKQHEKLFAVTETGISEMNKKGEVRSSWYQEILDIIRRNPGSARGKTGIGHTRPGNSRVNTGRELETGLSAQSGNGQSRHQLGKQR